MGSLAIKVENISKQYRLGVVNYGHLAKDLQSLWARLRGRDDPNAIVGDAGIDRKPKRDDRFWALRDVSFDVEQGERLGIIGRNGAGKSTLLKILSRVTAPTEGVVKVKGKVASLLEVGTGFNPELTGRENIFLNGAILGMSKGEVRKKFDEIVDFAEVARFIDTPVKRYSSGMYVRLAFAVAAHLEPDILVIDEVLAVGDASFQKKCLGKMDDVSKKQGRTVIFVSHNMSAISSLCESCILLSMGRIEGKGRTSETLMKYYAANGRHSDAHADYASLPVPIGDKHARLLSASVVNSQGKVTHEISIHDSFRVNMKYRIQQESSAKLVPNFHFFTSDGTRAFVDNAPGVMPMSCGDYEATCEVPADLLNDGTYTIGVALSAYSKTSLNICFFEREALSVHVRDPLDLKSNRYGYRGEVPGVVRPHLRWALKEVRN